MGLPDSEVDTEIGRAILPRVSYLTDPPPVDVEEVVPERYDAHQAYVTCTCFTHPGAPCALTVYPDRAGH